ncbi:GNAT family N-acetyltransferase [Noviherbaspirillum denitrificans]|uniref:N-acetyltransferase domain-containing protein n=1 Tax=Noviherbaspirillum denitrificans TaxID=1968433 RepID=A0A254TE73_9BURK|nr:GNAT family N-acetyltransferase [Noviherbaspirillum denitrificans]OWW20930.1 hypothetical protein AYR66_17110 [Noviherbaspirillum denitrificans]
MPAHRFIVADANAHAVELIELNVEYLTWVFEGIGRHFGIPQSEVAGTPASEYAPAVIGQVCGDPPPRGIFYLIEVDGTLAGMGGLRFLHAGAAEIKRVYLRRQYRGMNLGAAIVERLLADAAAFGYRHVFLDTAPFMAAAHRLYENSGFTDCAPYEGTEVPPAFHARWRFMCRSLQAQK